MRWFPAIPRITTGRFDRERNSEYCRGGLAAAPGTRGGERYRFLLNDLAVSEQALQGQVSNQIQFVLHSKIKYAKGSSNQTPSGLTVPLASSS